MRICNKCARERGLVKGKGNHYQTICPYCKKRRYTDWYVQPRTDNPRIEKTNEIAKELWKALPENPDVEVSNLGNLKYKGNLINKFQKGHEYKRVSFRNVQERYVHRLVARMWVPHCTGGDLVNHENGNKMDNRACNLKWVTNRENQLLAARSNKYYHHGKVPVLAISPSGEESAYESIRAASKGTGVYETSITRTIKGKYKSPKGWHFKRLDGRYEGSQLNFDW